MTSEALGEGRADMGVWRSLLIGNVLGHTAVAFLDRILFSATNFAVGVLLIRRTPDAEYGLYVLAHSVILLTIGFQNALITTPMLVMAPKQEPSERQNFISTLGKTQYLIWLPLCVVTLLASVLSYQFGVDSETAWIIFAIAIVALFVFAREFMRHAFFVYMLPQNVFLVDIVYAALFLGAVYSFTTVSPSPALYTIIAMGAAGLLAGIFGFVLFSRRIGWKFTWDISSLRITWRHGKWALMGVCVTWLHNQGFLYLLTALEGIGEVASVSASKLLLMPITMMMAGIIPIIKPRGAAWLATGNKPKLLQITALLTGGVLLVAVVYSGILLFEQKRISGFLFNKEIAHMNSLLLLWGVVFITQIVRTSLSMLFQIFERFRTLFYIGTLAAISSLSIGYWTIHTFGTLGSLVGLIVGEMTYILCMGWVYLGQPLRKTRGLKQAEVKLSRTVALFLPRDDRSK